ncbi:MAG TPA: hypothetical protein VHW60_00165 [Caulobacteraceae bacterium]|jgi:hypothetical protein|nr:hypothetical protein [Caulobacteraceae bacterium]
MRLGPLLIAALFAACAWSAQAQTAQEVARDQFQAQLSEQCPEKQLQMLSVRQLRDGLDDYKEGLSQDQQTKLQQAETAQCSSLDDGAACVNMADVGAASDMGQLTDLTNSICSDFLRCTDQGVCDYAR